MVSIFNNQGLKFVGKTFDSFIGFDTLFYDSIDKKFVYQANSADTTWTDSPVVIPTGSIVKQYRFKIRDSIFTVMNSDGVGGAVYKNS